MSDSTVESVKQSFRPHEFLLLFLLCCSLALNVYLAPKRIAANQNHQSPSESGRSLVVHGPIPQLPVDSIEGNHIDLAFRGKPLPTVLYFFTPSCIWCRRNLSSLESLVGLTKDKYVFYGISLTNDGLSDYLQHNRLPFQVYSVSKNTPISLQPNATPTTLVLDANGFIQKRWDGAFTGDNKREIESYFSCSLPEISSI
ncbi:TlpA family protein disulfide reductase [Terracidiphilus sp.]|uniref:TlpA family protein disulfide reductase n=1 Tax=Terracidiphilus sp. TaxID=1964191 RepID=UPI003C137F09